MVYSLETILILYLRKRLSTTDCLDTSERVERPWMTFIRVYRYDEAIYEHDESSDVHALVL